MKCSLSVGNSNLHAEGRSSSFAEVGRESVWISGGCVARAGGSYQYRNSRVRSRLWPWPVWGHLRARIDEWSKQAFQPDVADYFLRGPGMGEKPFEKFFNVLKSR